MDHTPDTLTLKTKPKIDTFFNAKECLENKQTIELYVKLYSTTEEKMKEAIKTVYLSYFSKVSLEELSIDDNIKESDLLKGLDIYFENNPK